MKNSRKLITIILVLTLALSTCLFSACNFIPGTDDTQGGTNSGDNNTSGLYTLTFAAGDEGVVGTAPLSTSALAAFKLRDAIAKWRGVLCCESGEFT